MCQILIIINSVLNYSYPSTSVKCCCASVVCKQTIHDMLLHARLAAQWLRRNQTLFSGPVQFPAAVDANEQQVSRWLARAAVEQTNFEQLRDSTLFNFSNRDDIWLFIRLVCSGLHIAANVILDGMQYIANNAEEFN